MRDIYAEIISAAHSGSFGMNSLPHPTAEQLRAGNYKKGKVALHGMTIAIETPQGQRRMGKSDGQPWSVICMAHYGYIVGTKASDGDAIDVYVGPVPESTKVWVVNQNDKAGNFDEVKVLLGFHDEQSARAAYMNSYERDWKGLGSLIACSVDQFRWWLKFGDTTKPLTERALPHDGTQEMTETVWDSAANPVGCDVADLIYRLRGEDSEGLMLDAVTLNDILESSDGEMTLDALVVQYNQVERKAEQLRRIMESVGGEVKPLSVQITPPFKQRGTTNVVILFELSDGQTVSVWMHNPDSTPNRIKPDDELVSWAWRLNKKDVSIIVAPEKGQDLNPREVSRRIMRLAEKNSARFAKANAGRAERMANIESMKSSVAEKEATLAALDTEHEELTVKVTAKRNRVPATLQGTKQGADTEIEMTEQTVATLPPSTVRNQAVKAALSALGWNTAPSNIEVMVTIDRSVYSLKSSYKEVRGNLVSVEWADAGARWAMTDDLSKSAADFASDLDKAYRQSIADARAAAMGGDLPAGWTEQSPGGMATNKDPENGGIVDKVIGVNEWFVVFNREGMETIDGLASRADAFRAFADAMEKADSVTETVEQTAARLEAINSYKAIEAEAAGMTQDQRNALGAHYGYEGTPMAYVIANLVLAAVSDRVLTAEGYAKIVGDDEALLAHQDQLDSFFGSRIVAVRNALRDLGWSGDGRELRKVPYSFEANTKNLGAGRNVVGVRYEVTTSEYGSGFEPVLMVDDLTKTPMQIASELDAALPKAAVEPETGFQVSAGALAEATSKAIPFGKLYSDSDYRKQIANLTKALLAMGFKKWQAESIITSAKTIAARNANGRMNFLRPAEVVQAADSQGYVEKAEAAQVQEPAQKSLSELARSLIPAEFESREDSDGLTFMAADGFGVRLRTGPKGAILGYVLDAKGQDSLGSRGSDPAQVKDLVDTALSVIEEKRSEAPKPIDKAAALAEFAAQFAPFLTDSDIATVRKGSLPQELRAQAEERGFGERSTAAAFNTALDEEIERKKAEGDPDLKNYEDVNMAELMKKPAAASIKNWFRVNTANGTRWTAGGNLMDYASEEPAIRGWETRKDAVRDKNGPSADGDRIKPTTGTELTPVAIERGIAKGRSAVILESKLGDVVSADLAFVQYFLSQYKARADLKLSPSGTVGVFVGGEPVGVIAPIRGRNNMKRLLSKFKAGVRAPQAEEVPVPEQTRTDWDAAVAAAVAEALGITTADAQGIIEGQDFYMTQSWGKGMNPQETADKVIAESRAPEADQGSQQPSGPEVVSSADQDPNIGRTWNSQWGPQQITAREVYPSGDLYVVSSEDGTVRKYSVKDIDSTIASQEYQLTPEYAAEQAEKAARAQRMAEVDARQAAEAARLDAEIAEFTAGMSAPNAEKARQALLTNVMADGGVISRKALIEKLVAEGRTIGEFGGKRTLQTEDGSFRDEKQITKTGMDYAEYLIAKRGGADDASAEAKSFLNDVIAGNVDYMDETLADRLEAVATQYEGDAEVQQLFEQAANAYSAYMIEQARAAMA